MTTARMPWHASCAVVHLSSHVSCVRGIKNEKHNEGFVVCRFSTLRRTHAKTNGEGACVDVRAREAQRIEVQCRSRLAGALSLIFNLHSVHRAKHFHVVRLEAVLLCLLVAVGFSKVQRAGATALFARLGGATGPYLSLVYEVPLAKVPRRPRTSWVRGRT